MPRGQNDIPDSHCTQCGENISYDAAYDSMYCPACNEWTEKNCGDPECRFCADRPENPLPVEDKPC